MNSLLDLKNILNAAIQFLPHPTPHRFLAFSPNKTELTEYGFMVPSLCSGSPTPSPINLPVHSAFLSEAGEHPLFGLCNFLSISEVKLNLATIPPKLNELQATFIFTPNRLHWAYIMVLH